MTPNELQNFLTLSYGELEDLNLAAKSQRQGRVPMHQIQEERLKYLTDEKRIKAVTVLFSDLEGRLHMLDYDKKFLVKSWDNLTFDGSSIRGFTAQRESDLRLHMDWSAFYWGPSDVFGAGKVMVFGEVIDKDGTPYSADIRGVLKGYAQSLYEKNGYTLNAANEIEGFIFNGPDAERHYHETGKFEYVNTGGYYHSLPGDPLRHFIDRSAEVQRAMGFENEKDHPEVAPSQFEINYCYSEVVAAADQIQLYKLICRQVATQHGADGEFPAQAGGGRERQRHAHQRVGDEERQEHLLGSEGRREDEQVRLAVRGPHSDARQRHLPAAEPERERVPAAGSALRSAEPDQGVGGGSRVDDPHPDRQRAEFARGSALGGAGRESVPGDAERVQDGAGRRDREDQESARQRNGTCRTTSTMRWRTSRTRSGPRRCWAKT